MACGCTYHLAGVQDLFSADASTKQRTGLESRQPLAILYFMFVQPGVNADTADLAD